MSKLTDLLHSHCKSLIAAQQSLHQLQEQREECRQLVDLITELPNRVGYSVMVPFTRHAFFPGRLIHTNELMVDLGNKTFASQSANQTVGILQRRIDVIDANIEECMKSVDSLKKELEILEEQRDLVDIREEYDENLHGDVATSATRQSTASVSTSVQSDRKVPAPQDDTDFDALMKKFEERARLEEEGGAEGAEQLLEEAAGQRVSPPDSDDELDSDDDSDGVGAAQPQSNISHMEGSRGITKSVVQPQQPRASAQQYHLASGAQIPAASNSSTTRTTGNTSWFKRGFLDSTSNRSSASPTGPRDSAAATASGAPSSSVPSASPPPPFTVGEVVDREAATQGAYAVAAAEREAAVQLAQPEVTAPPPGKVSRFKQQRAQRG